MHSSLEMPPQHSPAHWIIHRNKEVAIRIGVDHASQCVILDAMLTTWTTAPSVRLCGTPNPTPIGESFTLLSQFVPTARKLPQHRAKVSSTSCSTSESRGWQQQWWRCLGKRFLGFCLLFCDRMALKGILFSLQKFPSPTKPCTRASTVLVCVYVAIIVGLKWRDPSRCCSACFFHHQMHPSSWFVCVFL